MCTRRGGGGGYGHMAHGPCAGWGATGRRIVWSGAEQNRLTAPTSQPSQVTSVTAPGLPPTCLPALRSARRLPMWPCHTGRARAAQDVHGWHWHHADARTQRICPPGAFAPGSELQMAAHSPTWKRLPTGPGGHMCTADMQAGQGGGGGQMASCLCTAPVVSDVSCERHPYDQWLQRGR